MYIKYQLFRGLYYVVIVCHVRRADSAGSQF